jgi:hypothetical protein
LVESVAAPERIGLGDIVVLRNRERGVSIVHRVVCRSEGLFPFHTKGDRNRQKDPQDPAWEFQGVVTRRFRQGIWTVLGWRRSLWFLSVSGLYPGQRLPAWLTRTAFRKVLRRGGA